MTISKANFAKSEMDEYADLVEFYDGTYYTRVTAYHDTIVFGGNSYKPAPVQIGKITRTISVEGVTTDITAPLTDQLSRYIANHPVIPTTVNIYRVIVSDPNNNYVNLFSGKVKNVGVNDSHMATANCITRSSILNVVWPKDIHSSFCQNTLFDAGCGLDKNLYSKNFTVQSVGTDGSLTSTDIGTDGPKFTHGYVLFLNDFRWITNGTTNKFYLHVPFPSDVKVGTVLQAFWGCSGSITDCKDKFNNVSRFYAFKDIPSDNPVMWGV